MGFEAVQIHSTRDGAAGVDGYRQDLAVNEVVGLSLTSLVGVSSVRWELLGVPEGSSAGGGGPEPILLAVAPTASFTVDNDADVPLDGSYVVRATINPGSPGEEHKTTVLARLSGLTVPGPGGSSLPLRMLGAFEALEDTADATVRQGYAKQLDRWLRKFRTIVLGAGVPTTLAGSYSIGASAADQRPVLLDAKGGKIEINGANGGYTGTILLQLTSRAGGPIVFEENGRIGIGTTTPAVPLEIAANTPTIRLNAAAAPGNDWDLTDDGTDLIVKVGSTTVAIFRAAGGVQAPGGFGANVAPPAGAAYAMADGTGLAVAPANTARIRYLDALKRLEHSESTGPWRPFTSIIDCDSIAKTSTVRLDQQSIVGLDRTAIAWVETVGDFFRLDPTSTVTADEITVVTAAGGTGRWLRMYVPNPKWHAVATWSYDPSNTSGVGGLASDENAGTSDGAPLRTFAEWTRRMRGARISAARVLRLLSHEDDTTAGNFDIDITIVDGGYIELRANPPVIATGTLTAGTVAGSGNTPDVLEDTALNTSWSNADGLGKNLVSSTANGTKLIRAASGNIRGFPTRDLGSKKVRVTKPSSTSEDTTTAFSGVAASFTGGTAYEVLGLLRFPGIRSNHNVPNAVRGIFLDFGVGSSTARIQGSSIQLQLCGFRNFSSHNPTLGFGYYQCIWTSTSGASMSGANGNGVVSRFGTFLGNGTTTFVETVGGTINWNGCTNTFDACGFNPNHSSKINHTGSLYCFDLGVTQTLVAADLNTNVAIDEIWGSGIAGFFLSVARNSFIGLLPSQLHAVSSHPTPFILITTGLTLAQWSSGPQIVIGANTGFIQ